MAQLEKLKYRMAELEKRFAGVYDKCTIGGRECFCTTGDLVLRLDYIDFFGALVIEYAENHEEAQLNRFEDGDLFYLEDMDVDTMFQAMCREIEQ